MTSLQSQSEPSSPSITSRVRDFISHAASRIRAFIMRLLPCFTSSSDDDDDEGRDALPTISVQSETSPFILHVPPNYSMLSAGLEHSRGPSPRPILKPSRTPSERSDSDPDLEAQLDGLGEHERETARKWIRFDSVPEIRWIEAAERRRSFSHARSKDKERRPSFLESWIAGMTPNPKERESPAFATRLRYDQMVY